MRVTVTDPNGKQLSALGRNLTEVIADPYNRANAAALRDLLGGEGGAFVVMVENHRFVSYTPLGDLLDQNGDVVLTVHKKQVVKAAFVNKPEAVATLKPVEEAAAEPDVEEAEAPPADDHPTGKRGRAKDSA